MNDDIRHFFEINWEKSNELLWTHGFWKSSESGYIREKKCHFFSCSSKFYLFKIWKHWHDKIMREILRKGIF